MFVNRLYEPFHLSKMLKKTGELWTQYKYWILKHILFRLGKVADLQITFYNRMIHYAYITDK